MCSTWLFPLGRLEEFNVLHVRNPLYYKPFVILTDVWNILIPKISFSKNIEIRAIIPFGQRNVKRVRFKSDHRINSLSWIVHCRKRNLTWPIESFLSRFPFWYTKAFFFIYGYSKCFGFQAQYEIGRQLKSTLTLSYIYVNRLLVIT